MTFHWTFLCSSLYLNKQGILFLAKELSVNLLLMVCLLFSLPIQYQMIYNVITIGKHSTSNLALFFCCARHQNVVQDIFSFVPVKPPVDNFNSKLMPAINLLIQNTSRRLSEQAPLTSDLLCNCQRSCKRELENSLLNKLMIKYSFNVEAHR